jgi:hypothetical protein
MSIEDPANIQACWCLYLGCFGQGLQKFTLDPVCRNTEKCLCLQGGGEFKVVGQMMPCLAQNDQCLCFRSACHLPPATPFVEILGFRVYGGAAKMKVQELIGKGFGSIHAEVEDLNEQIQEAVQKEDFLRRSTSHTVMENMENLQIGRGGRRKDGEGAVLISLVLEWN